MTEDVHCKIKHRKLSKILINDNNSIYASMHIVNSNYIYFSSKINILELHVHSKQPSVNFLIYEESSLLIRTTDEGSVSEMRI